MPIELKLTPSKSKIIFDWILRRFSPNICEPKKIAVSGSYHWLLGEPILEREWCLNLKTAVAGLKMPHLHEITLAFEFSVLTLTVPGLRAENFKILRAFAYLHHFYSP